MANTKKITVWLPTKLLEQTDAYAKRKRDELAGLRFTRSDAIRVLLTKALASESTEVTDA